MSISDLASHTAERTVLAHRIHRFIRALERVMRHPNRREAYHVVEAMQHMLAGRYGEGEDAMLRAERVAPVPAEAIAKLGPHEAMTTEQLRAGFEALLRREG